MRNNLRRSGSGVADLLGRVRYEVIPTDTIEDKVLASVPRDVTLTVTASPVKGLAATLELAERFAGHGYRVVPHISARLVVDEVHLKDIVERMRAIGIDDVFVPAGDADPPAGQYDSALPVLTELTAIGRPFSQVGITGYPESHPAIDDDITVQAMWDKRTHGTYIVSNLCFDPAVLVTWIRRVRRRNVTLPIQVGLAGPVERTKLVAMAAKIGVGESAKFLTKHPSWLLRLAAPGGYSPERLLQSGADYLTLPEAGVAGLHVFTFNQVAETEAWRQRLLARAASS
jgi:methylenetetrahydrofolate reductase (NADPH)